MPTRASRPVYRLAWALLIAACVGPTVVHAQPSLGWDRLDVTAHLDADGTLHIVETHAMVFTGDWNGGERAFNIRPRQQVTLSGIARIGPDGPVDLTEDDSLDDVNDYAWADRTTLRWRSRRPSDPPFAETRITYELRYALSGILLEDGNGYQLDHDFAFPDREGTIERFGLRLTFDPAWQPSSDVEPFYAVGPLPPGRSFVLTIPLQYRGAGTPAALDTSRSPAIIGGVLAILSVLVLVVAWLFVREESIGRFAPLAVDIDAAWLREHVFAYRPEVVAAAWDEHIGKAEVVALLAGLEADGVIESSVSAAKGADMTLRLKSDGRALNEYESALIDKLFFHRRLKTTTSAVRKHYKDSGFNPADEIRPGLEAAVEAILPPGPAPRRRLPIAGLAFAIGLGLVLWTWWTGAPMVWWPLAAAAVLTGMGSISGTLFRRYPHWGRVAALVCLIPAVAIAAVMAWFLWWPAGTGDIELRPVTVLGMVAMAVAWIFWSVDSLRSRRHRAAMAFRKQLAAARAFFAGELGKPNPALADEWYPWLLAFGLGRDVDRWSTIHAGTIASRNTGSTSWSSSSSPGSSGWTGLAGGRSGGAGGGASWQAAAGGMAAGVSASSGSSSSGGGSSGGSSGGGSSGGGGGGGW